jgi:hypothetical protein
MGLKNFFKRILPDHQVIREHRNLRVLGTILHDPNIFHITKRSVAGGVSLGFFWACIPVPGQMLLSAITAIFFKVNLPLSVILVWITNPVTIPPYLFIAYKTGAWLLNLQPGGVHFETPVQWFTEELVGVWQPLLLGCLIYAVLCSAAGYILIRGLWRLTAILKWQARKHKQANNKN